MVYSLDRTHPLQVFGRGRLEAGHFHRSELERLIRAQTSEGENDSGELQVHGLTRSAIPNSLIFRASSEKSVGKRLRVNGHREQARAANPRWDTAIARASAFAFVCNCRSNQLARWQTHGQVTSHHRFPSTPTQVRPSPESCLRELRTIEGPRVVVGGSRLECANLLATRTS
jgi:hypothetical protein